MKVGIILTPDVRSKAYLQKLENHNIILDEIIFMNDGRKEIAYSKDMVTESLKCGFDISKSVLETLNEKRIKFKEFDFVDINNSTLINFLQKNPTDFFIFTGGGILKKDVLSIGKKFIHFHPGIVPDYRGSTCFYYSIINEDKCGVTAFIMNEGLDTGKIVFQKLFQKPNHVFIDDVYDSHIRSETMIELIKNNLLEKNNFKEQDPNKGETYFIIHPVLKHIATLSCITAND